MKNYYEIIKYNQILRTYKIKKKIKFLLNFNNFQLNSYTEYYLKKKRIDLKSVKSNYDQIYQELKTPKNFYNTDYLIFCNDYNNFENKSKNLDFRLKFFLSQVEILINLKKKIPKLEIIVFNFPDDYFKEYLDNENIINKNKINKFNLDLINISKKNNLSLLDYNSLICKIGQNNFYDSKNYYLSKSLLSEIACNEISLELSKIIRASIFVKKKCLVLDLDNTLWGGILGESNVRAIKLGNSYEGLKYTKFQKYIKKLSDEGIILAIASKNNYSDVKNFFKENDNMILKLSDFSSIKANWKPKYENINEIANELNIGIDSLVFFDDSKFEREQMKKFIPEVEVIDVPNEPDKFVSTLENSGVFFNNNSLTKEDYKKKTQYEIRQKAENLKKNFNSIDEYLKQLRMKISFNKVNNKNIERCVQMLNKTNQFNFTTRRYSMATFKEYISDSKIVSLVVSVEDKLGDYGITGLLTASKNKKTLSIDNFLLSCRILGRKIEDQIINKVIDIASKKKLEFIEGIYIKTLKNSQCENFYINKNFKKINKKKYIFNLKK